MAVVLKYGECLFRVCRRKHFYPRQPKSSFDGAVKDGKLITTREGNTLYYECAIPWSEIPDVKKAIDKGDKIKFSARINDDGAGAACMELARGQSSFEEKLQSIPSGLEGTLGE